MSVDIKHDNCELTLARTHTAWQNSGVGDESSTKVINFGVQ